MIALMPLIFMIQRRDLLYAYGSLCSLDFRASGRLTVFTQ